MKEMVHEKCQMTLLAVLVLTAVLKIYAFLVADTFFKQPHVFAYLHADSSITQANLVSITFMLVECLVCRLSYSLG